MTLYQFRLLIPRTQLLHALTAGTYLAQHWERQVSVNLCHCTDEWRGFFVEVGYDEATLETQVLRSFSSSVPLEDYTHYVQLPGGFRN